MPGIDRDRPVTRLLGERMEQQGRTACLAFSRGCPRARIDTAVLHEYLKTNGWNVVPSIEAADLVLFTGCGFDGESEALAFRLLDKTERRRKAGSRLAVLGCVSATSADRVRQEHPSAEVIPPLEMRRLDRIVGGTTAYDDMPDPFLIEPVIDEAKSCFDSKERFGSLGGFLYDAGVPKVLTRFHLRKDSELVHADDICSIRVAWGCRGSCAYCSMRDSYGPLRSKALDQVLAEFDAGLDRGQREFRLMAQDLGAYGQDIGTDFTALLSAMFERGGDYALHLIDVNVRWAWQMRERLIPLLADNAEHVSMLQMPVQSGSDRILRLMGRGHTAEQASSVFHDVREALPDLPLVTHALVGFPSETDEDFEDTRRLLRTGRFDQLQIFGFSPRPGTRAAEMPDRVPQEVINSRCRQLHSEYGGPAAGLLYSLKSSVLSLAAPRTERAAAS